jgi:hypothetical protein
MKLQGALGVLRSGLESVVKEAVGAVEDAALHVSNMKSVSNYKVSQSVDPQNHCPVGVLLLILWHRTPPARRVLTRIIS